MNKKKSLTIILITIIVGILLFLSSINSLTIDETLPLPTENKVLSIQLSEYNLTDYYVVDDAITISKIYTALLKSRKSIYLKSVNDSPTNVKGNIIKLLITDDKQDTTTLFAYESTNGNYYFEMPYVGIYKISTEYYSVITHYLEVS